MYLGRENMWVSENVLDQIDHGFIIRTFKDFFNKIVYSSEMFGYVQNSFLQDCGMLGNSDKVLQIIIGHRDDGNGIVNPGVVEMMDVQELEERVMNYGDKMKFEEVLFYAER